MATTAIQVPVERVTLDARAVAEIIATVLEVEERISGFNQRQDTDTNTQLMAAGIDLFTGSFGPIEYGDDGPIGLFKELEDLAKARVRGGNDA